MNVLLTIDLQEASDGAYSQWDMLGVIERVNRLGETVRVRGGSLVHVLHDATADEGLEPGSPGWQPVPSLNVLPDDPLVRKSLNDAFYESGLESKLAELNVDRLLIAGWATDFCGDSTVRSAVARGYRVCVAADCHTLNDRPHLCAQDVIVHHNWVWRGLLSNASIEVATSLQLIEWFEAKA